MNKAFVREPEEPDPRCPSCGVLGVSVPRTTVSAHLPLEAVMQLSESAWYCGNPRCPAAYYDASGASVGVELLRGRAYPKDPDAPICSCFRLTADAVERDARAGITEGVKALIAKSRTAAARCATASPSGQCCVPEVQRLFLRSAGKARGRA